MRKKCLFSAIVVFIFASPKVFAYFSYILELFGDYYELQTDSNFRGTLYKLNSTMFLNLYNIQVDEQNQLIMAQTLPSGLHVSFSILGVVADVLQIQNNARQHLTSGSK